MSPDERPSPRGAEANPLWRWECAWRYAARLAAICPFVFLVAFGFGYRPFGPPSPHAGYCGNCAFADLVRTVVGFPVGLIGSVLVGGTAGGILDCLPNLFHRSAVFPPNSFNVPPDSK